MTDITGIVNLALVLVALGLLWKIAVALTAICTLLRELIEVQRKSDHERN